VIPHFRGVIPHLYGVILRLGNAGLDGRHVRFQTWRSIAMAVNTLPARKVIIHKFNEIKAGGAKITHVTIQKQKNRHFWVDPMRDLHASQ
jgi:hypothetical protein